MATPIQNLSQLITEFRALQAKDSVTPESLGYLLQQLASLVEQSTDSSVQYLAALNELREEINDRLANVGALSEEERASLSAVHELHEAIAAKLDKSAGVLIEGTRFAVNDNGDKYYLRLGAANSYGFKGIDVPHATSSLSGFMSREDKRKLDELPSASALAEQLANIGSSTPVETSEPCIAYADLDTMGTAGDWDAMYDLADSLTKTRYYVTGPDDGFVIGTLDVFTDSMRHVLTQVLTTHAGLNEAGELAGGGASHYDGKVFQYFRSYNIESPTLDNGEGTWSPWQEITPSAIAELAQNVPTVQNSVEGTPANFIYSGRDAQQQVMVVANTNLQQFNGSLIFNRGYWKPVGDNSDTVSADVVPTATTSADGAMSRADKVKLDGIAIFPFDGFEEGSSSSSSSGVYFDTAANKFNIYSSNINPANYNHSVGRVNPVEMARTDVIFLHGSALYRFDDTVGAMVLLTPTAQSGNNGTAANYIYSTNGSPKTEVVVRENTGFVTSGNLKKLRIGCWSPSGGVYYTLDTPVATTSCSGMMSHTDKAKLDALPTNATLQPYLTKVNALPDALSLSANIGSKANVFAHESGATDKRAIKGELLFALKASSTADEVKAALTEFTTKAVLNYAELLHCAEHGTMLYDETTQGFVQVTHNGAGFFCFTEVSSLNYAELPRLRFAALRVSEDGLTFKAMRDSVCDAIVTMGQMYAVLQQFVDMMESFDSRITALEN